MLHLEKMLQLVFFLSPSSAEVIFGTGVQSSAKGQRYQEMQLVYGGGGELNISLCSSLKHSNTYPAELPYKELFFFHWEYGLKGQAGAAQKLLSSAPC